MNQADTQFSKVGFVGRYLLPLFLIFLIPGFSLWFFTHVQNYYDRQFLSMAEKEIQDDAKLTQAERDKGLSFYRKAPLSRLLASNNPELAEFQNGFTPKIRRDFMTFRWMIRIARFCIWTGIIAFIIAGISVLFSLRSQLAQYYSLLTGWHVLRIVATLQVMGQGILVFALSFWVTAFFMEQYWPKLVIIGAVLAVGAIFFVIVAIFKKIDQTFNVEGRILDEASAAPLIGHLSAVAANLGIEPPNQIIAGIDDNFFVTEHTVTAGDKTVSGKTLFVSLSLLRNCTREEANAVLAHEMAHFSGSDTVYSKKISPLLSRYAEYLKALHAGGVSRPVFYFMLAFWSLYQLSIQRLSRQREFRADAVAAQQTSPGSLANALVKIAAFSRYRGKVEEDLFKKEEVHESVNIPAQVASGFPEFIRGCIAASDLGESKTTHPFDSHPTMRERFQAVGIGEVKLDEKTLLEPVADSWYGEIPGADKVEAELWDEYQNEFKKAHELSLAYRYAPAGEQETAIVLKHFPALEFIDKKGNKLVIDYRHVHFSKWSEPIRYEEIANCTASESFGSKYLKIEFTRDGKKADEKFCLSGYKDAEVLMEHFKKYYTRHLASREFQKEKEKEKQAAEKNSETD